MAQVLGEEGDHLPADLQVGDVGVQIDAIQALQVEGHMAVEEVVDVARHSHGTTSARGQARITLTSHSPAVTPDARRARRSEAGLTGWLVFFAGSQAR